MEAFPSACYPGSSWKGHTIKTLSVGVLLAVSPQSSIFVLENVMCLEGVGLSFLFEVLRIVLLLIMSKMEFSSQQKLLIMRKIVLKCVVLLQPIFDVIENNTTLKSINLETNYLSGDFFARLFKAALVNQTLEEVKAVNQVNFLFTRLL